MSDLVFSDLNTIKFRCRALIRGEWFIVERESKGGPVAITRELASAGPTGEREGGDEEGGE